MHGRKIRNRNHVYRHGWRRCRCSRLQVGCKGCPEIRSDPAGGGKVAGATIWLPRRQRVLIGVDDTDTPEEGATWTLVHNIAKTVEDAQSVYLSHTIVQLFPVPYRTKNCVSLVAEFATSDPEGLAERFEKLLQKVYALGKNRDGGIFRFLASEELLAYGRKVKRGEIDAGLIGSHRRSGPADRHERPGDYRGGGSTSVLYPSTRRHWNYAVDGSESPTSCSRFGPAHRVNRLTGSLPDLLQAQEPVESGAIFFSMGSHRVKLAINPLSAIEIAHRGGGVADLYFEGQLISGRLLEPGFHCPDQAFITVTGSCIFHCRYCSVPHLQGERKSIEEIVGMVESVRHRINSISITSGVLTSIEEEEIICHSRLIEHLAFFGLPIGVSIYPTEQTPDRLKALGVAEVKFNLEAATPAIFSKMCPGLDYDLNLEVLDRSVELFGKNRVFSNVIIGLGETDGELEACIRKLTSRGIIPVLRPLNPVADLTGTPRPSQSG